MNFNRLPLRTLSAVVLTALSMLIGSAALATRDAKLAAIDIDNFGVINDTYYRGAQPKDDDYETLAAAGVKTVIDLQEDFAERSYARTEAADVAQAGMKFYRIPMTTHVPPTPRQIEQFLAIVNDPANQPVYVHCKGGRHRTGVMTAIYRMERDGWTADRAYNEMKDYEFGWSFLHPEFKEFVYDYYDHKRAAAVTAPTAAIAVGATQ